MRLYFIKRITDRKFFVSINGYWALHSNVDGQYWSDKPQTFLKTPEGVAGNLRKICSRPFWQTIAPDTIKVKEGWCELGWKDFDKEKLSAYEIVIMDVDILSMSATPATDFIQIEAIAKRPLNRVERQHMV